MRPLLPGLNSGTNDHAAAAVTRDGALDQEKVSLAINAYDLKVLHGAAHATHVARHLLALEYAARRLVLAD